VDERCFTNSARADNGDEFLHEADYICGMVMYRMRVDRRTGHP
jgi:hypothetical protein